MQLSKNRKICPRWVKILKLKSFNIGSTKEKKNPSTSHETNSNAKGFAVKIDVV